MPDHLMIHNVAEQLKEKGKSREYVDGFKAALYGDNRNPYHSESDKAHQWNFGWQRGRNHYLHED